VNFPESADAKQFVDGFHPGVWTKTPGRAGKSKPLSAHQVQFDNTFQLATRRSVNILQKRLL